MYFDPYSRFQENNIDFINRIIRISAQSQEAMAQPRRHITLNTEEAAWFGLPAGRYRPYRILNLQGGFTSQDVINARDILLARFFRNQAARTIIYDAADLALADVQAAEAGAQAQAARAAAMDARDRAQAHAAAMAARDRAQAQVTGGDGGERGGYSASSGVPSLDCLQSFCEWLSGGTAGSPCEAASSLCGGGETEGVSQRSLLITNTSSLWPVSFRFNFNGLAAAPQTFYLRGGGEIVIPIPSAATGFNIASGGSVISAGITHSRNTCIRIDPAGSISVLPC